MGEVSGEGWEEAGACRPPPQGREGYVDSSFSATRRRADLDLGFTASSSASGRIALRVRMRSEAR
jgi:hypothetical protein